MDAIEQLAVEGADLMMKGAIEFCRSRNLTNEQIMAKADLMVKELKVIGGDAVRGAMKDAKDAIDSGMSGYATATFQASCRLAGIKVAQKILEA